MNTQHWACTSVALNAKGVAAVVDLVHPQAPVSPHLSFSQQQTESAHGCANVEPVTKQTILNMYFSSLIFSLSPKTDEHAEFHPVSDDTQTLKQIR